MRNTNSLPKATFESAWASIQEMTKAIKATDAKIEESSKKWEKQTAENQKIYDSIKAMQQEQAIENQKRHDSIKAMQQEIGGMGQSNGAVAESYFVNSFTNAMQFAGQEYDEMDHHLRKKSKKLNLQNEYDLVLYNCTSVVIIEIKYKARERDVVRLLAKAPVFKQLYPQYANYDMYLALAAFHFEENTENDSIEHGIAVIKQVGDTMVINDEHLRVF
ncbi:MAG: hypothetical protein FWD09_08810 [Lentimicrobiaceae bacterium]|nr:hypothetical protein [Lentimicrobiaceae bacterium]